MSEVLQGVVTRIDNRGHAWEITAVTSARSDVTWMTQHPPMAGSVVRITIEVAPAEPAGADDASTTDEADLTSGGKR